VDKGERGERICLSVCLEQRARSTKPRRSFTSFLLNVARTEREKEGRIEEGPSKAKKGTSRRKGKLPITRKKTMADITRLRRREKERLKDSSTTRGEYYLGTRDASPAPKGRRKNAQKEDVRTGDCSVLLRKRGKRRLQKERLMRISGSPFLLARQDYVSSPESRSMHPQEGRIGKENDTCYSMRKLGSAREKMSEKDWRNGRVSESPEKYNKVISKVCTSRRKGTSKNCRNWAKEPTTCRR